MFCSARRLPLALPFTQPGLAAAPLVLAAVRLALGTAEMGTFSLLRSAPGSRAAAETAHAELEHR